MRAFIALNLPEKIRELLHEKAKNMENLFKGKITEPGNMHLTLKFLGEIDENQLEAVKKMLGEIKQKKFESFLGNLGVFDEKFIRIIWVHLIGAEELQKKIDRVLQAIFPKEERFQSHVTIARVKNVKERGSLLDSLKNTKLSNIKFPVESFELMKSELSPSGSVYSVIKEYKLEQEK